LSSSSSSASAASGPRDKDSDAVAAPPLLETTGAFAAGTDGAAPTFSGEAVAVLPLQQLPIAMRQDDGNTGPVGLLGLPTTGAFVAGDEEAASRKPATPPPPLPPRRFVRRKFRSSVSDLLQAALVGVVSGLSVALFKLSIEAVREVSYQQDVLASAEWLRATIPALGGCAVGLLLLVDKSRAFPPGLRGVVKIVDDQERACAGGLSSKDDFMAQVRTQLGAVRKSVAAVFTLGSGCSLGPEGPCVEIGMTIARACMGVVKPRAGTTTTTTTTTSHWNLLLLSCGAAAGVAAGFNAPIAGVFFALEVVQNAWVSIREERANDDNGGPNQLPQSTEINSSNIDRDYQIMGGWMGSTSTIAPVLLASILSALIARTLLGNHLVLALTEYSLKTPLLELPLYLGLGAVSGAIAFVFSQMAKLSSAFFAGSVGPRSIRDGMRALPQPAKPIVGGALCGAVGIYFPQILFFGYETLNALLANNALSTSLVLSLLLVKMVMTALSAGSGLVGGTFAPSLFLGAMTGAAFHNIVSSVLVFAMQFGFLHGLPLELADIPAYAMVGAASVLAALFRAPLTASLLLFELTRDYDVILPLMASAGVASLVGDILDDKLEQSRLHLVPRDQDRVSWGDLADKDDSNRNNESTQR
jgi:H+/Cl- antiporter ClcA